MLVLARPAFADREQAVNIEADRVTIDDRRKLHIFEGRVVLSQGSLAIVAERLTVTQGDSGFKTGEASGGEGGLARFHQQRVNDDGRTEGEAERIEYDASTQTARLFGRARVSSGGDEVRGDFIEYQRLTEQYRVLGGPGEQGRVRAVIQPKGEAPP